MRFRPAAYALIVQDGQVLLSHWTTGNRWLLPGGGLDFGEHPELGAVREVREETGYDVELTGLLAVNAHMAIPQIHAIQMIYLARIVGGELTRERDGSTDDARWFPLAEVERLPHTGVVDVALRHWRLNPEGTPLAPRLD